MTTYYAWSNFDVESNEHGQPTERIKPGEKVSQDILGVNDDDWNDFIAIGAVREDKYPENLPPHMSPAEYERSKIIPKTGSTGELMLPPQHDDGESEITGPTEEPEPNDILNKALGLG